MNDYKEETMISDVVESVGNGSLIQHGKHNDRIYLMKLKQEDAEELPHFLTKMARNRHYSKIFCKVPKWSAPMFYSNGFILEATIPQFYNGDEDAFFVSKYLCSDRLLNIEKDKLTTLGQLLHQTNNSLNGNIIANKYTVRPLKMSDADGIAHIYDEIFTTYPFPIHDPDFLKQSMQNDVFYYGAEKNGKLVAVAAAEVDRKGANAEMTDFATLKAHQGNKLASLILHVMEEEMNKQGIKTLYTIARLNSIPMNKTFLRFAYEYSGTLVKNTNIAGNIESMNIYYKHL
jgi:putative beta-lysine N-acetyltransferase